MHVPADDEEIVLRLLSPFEAWHMSEESPEGLTFHILSSLERWLPYDWSLDRQQTQERSKDESPSRSRSRQRGG
jgi:hypothetical protein